MAKITLAVTAVNVIVLKRIEQWEHKLKIDVPAY
jgi:hypothetical protein